MCVCVCVCVCVCFASCLISESRAIIGVESPQLVTVMSESRLWLDAKVESRAHGREDVGRFFQQECQPCSV